MTTSIIYSSHGLGPDNAAFKIDTASGRITEIMLNVADFGCVPTRFDVEEYRRNYGHTSATEPSRIDILDIGYDYTNDDGTSGHEDPEPGFRRRQHAITLDYLLRQLIKAVDSANLQQITEARNAAHRYCSRDHGF